MKNLLTILTLSSLFISCGDREPISAEEESKCYVPNAKVFIAVEGAKYKVQKGLLDNGETYVNVYYAEDDNYRENQTTLKYYVEGTRRGIAPSFGTCNAPDFLEPGMFIRVWGKVNKDSTTRAFDPAIYSEEATANVSFNPSTLEFSKIEIIQ